MTKVINFNEELRAKQAEDIEKRLAAWMEKTMPCRIGIFVLPEKELLNHPNFIKIYRHLILLQIQDILEHINFDKVFPLGCEEDKKPIFSFFDPTMTYNEAHKIKMVVDLVLQSRLGIEGAHSFPHGQGFLKKCLLFFKSLFLIYKAKIKIIFNFKK